MSTIFTSKKIWALYEQSCADGIRRLKKIPVFCGADPEFRGLSGWVFEKTIRFCLEMELKAAKVKIPIAEQFKLGSRAKADLCIGPVLVELKLSGFFSGDASEKYRRYRAQAARDGYSYLFFSGMESHLPYRGIAKKTFGANNTFYLDSSKDWQNFIRRVKDLLERCDESSI